MRWRIWRIRHNEPRFDDLMKFVESLNSMEWHGILNRYDKTLFQIGRSMMTSEYDVSKMFAPIINNQSTVSHIVLVLVLAGIEFALTRVLQSDHPIGVSITCTGPQCVDVIGVTGELHVLVYCDTVPVPAHIVFPFASLRIGSTFNVEHGSHVSDTVKVHLSMSDICIVDL
jgi:hypothetical protein